MNVQLRSLPSVLFDERTLLPDVMAVYVVTDHAGKVLYVGSTESLRVRWKSHHRRFQFKRIGQARIHWFLVDDATVLRSLESEWINLLTPSLNRQPVTDAQAVMIATLVSTETKQVLEYMARVEDRSVSKIVKKLVEDSPQFQEALKQIQVA